MKKFLFIAISAAACAFGQDITLSGTVSDKDGKPLSGVIVKLVTARLADTTAADGKYDFAGKSIAILAAGPRGGGVFYRAGRFVIADPGLGELEISLHDAAGARLATLFRGRAPSGNLEIPFSPDRMPHRALWLRVREGGRSASYRADAGALQAGRALASADAGRRLAKAAAASISSAAADWLQAYKPGYSAFVQELPAYAGTVNITLSASSDPDFGPNVLIFDPATPMATLQSRIAQVHGIQATAQFGTERFAYLLKPGAYNLNVDVDYNTQALGLGRLPDDVAITGSVRSMTTTANNNVTLMFWRVAENMSVTPSPTTTNTWAVSQGASFRRMHIKGALAVSMGGWASGGHLADSKIDGNVSSGSQQQWYSRNTEWGAWQGGVWNMFFDGVSKPPTGAWPASPYTVMEQVPRMREKPYLYIDAAGKYAVMLPPMRLNGQGAGWTKAGSAGEVPGGESVPIEMFHIARPGADDAAEINAALASGKHLLLTPGIYRLKQAVQVARPGTVVLGLGMATLVADAGTPALSVADVDGVRIAGIMIDAGAVESQVLMQVGEPGSAKDHAANPTSLHDIFIRVGGPRAGSAQAAMVVNSNDVLGDHFWLWRADHGAGAGWTGNKSKNGLIVNGNNVSMHGLFAEHFQEYQVLWNGENGRTHFFQSEIPYDPPSQDAWKHDGVNGYAAYKVAPAVKTHEAWGLGVYCNFHAVVQSDHAIEAPAAAGVKIRHAVSIWLNGAEGSGIGNVLNGTGGPVTKAKTKATID